MSLIVQAYRRGRDGEFTWLEVDFPFNTMAGPEAWRDAVWGSAEFQALGLELLPSLRSGDIYAEEADLQKLGAEVQQILAKTTDEGISFRTKNIQAAVRLALSQPGCGVYIG